MWFKKCFTGLEIWTVGHVFHLEYKRMDNVCLEMLRALYVKSVYSIGVHDNSWIVQWLYNCSSCTFYFGIKDQFHFTYQTKMSLESLIIGLFYTHHDKNILNRLIAHTYFSNFVGSLNLRSTLQSSGSSEILFQLYKCTDVSLLLTRVLKHLMSHDCYPIEVSTALKVTELLTRALFWLSIHYTAV